MDHVAVLFGFLVTQMAQNLPAMQETQVLSLGQEDPQEKWMVTHSSILPGEAHGQRSLATVHLVAKSRAWLSD